MYSETLGLRFVVPLIGFFGADNGVDEDYLPSATRDGIDPSALAVDVEEGTQALSLDEGGDPLLLRNDDLKTARIRLALARRDEPAIDRPTPAAPPPHRARRRLRPSGCSSPASRATSPHGGRALYSRTNCGMRRRRRLAPTSDATPSSCAWTCTRSRPTRGAAHERVAGAGLSPARRSRASPWACCGYDGGA